MDFGKLHIAILIVTLRIAIPEEPLLRPLFQAGKTGKNCRPLDWMVFCGFTLCSALFSQDTNFSTRSFNCFKNKTFRV